MELQFQFIMQCSRMHNGCSNGNARIVVKLACVQNVSTATRLSQNVHFNFMGAAVSGSVLLYSVL